MPGCPQSFKTQSQLNEHKQKHKKEENITIVKEEIIKTELTQLEKVEMVISTAKMIIDVLPGLS